MAWNKLATMFASLAGYIDVIVGTGGAPTSVVAGDTAIAIRKDATTVADMLHGSVDGGSTWLPIGGAPDPVTAGAATVAATSHALSVQRARLTLTNAVVALTDEAGVVAYGGVKVADFPAGAVCIIGATANLALTKSSAGVNADWDGDFAIGTATAGNDASLSGTEANVIPSTATPQAVSGATTAKGQTTTALSGTIVDGTATAVDLYLNVLVDDADHDVGGTACNILATGTIDITYAMLGDY